MQTVQELLAATPFFAGLGDEAIGIVAGCATNAHFRQGEYLFRAGDPADRFFVVRHGRVALELHAPGAGHNVLDTVEDGEVLGWSWLVPPHRWFLDARAVSSTDVISLDGMCLRRKCDEDPVLGYALLQRVAHVMYERLQSSRIRLLDLYGGGRAGVR
jgi:CRP-like cAMP-binding protein